MMLTDKELLLKAAQAAGYGLNARRQSEREAEMPNEPSLWLTHATWWNPLTDSGQALRDDRYKLIRFGTGAEGFYDLQTDPYEVTNLLTNAISAAQQQQHDRLLFRLYGYTTNTGPGIASQSFDGGQFSLSVTQAANYVLWRCSDLPNGFWAPVTNAVASTNGAVVTLKDIAPPSTGAFYGVVK